MSSLRARGIVCLLAAALSVAACGGEGSAEGRGTGVVRGIDTAKAQITLEHGDVPGLMQAMTMTFDVADPKLLEGIEVGDEVGFSLRYADGSYTVTDLRPR